MSQGSESLTDSVPQGTEALVFQAKAFQTYAVSLKETLDEKIVSH